VHGGLEQRLPHAHLGLGPDAAAELDDLAHRGHGLVERGFDPVLVRRRVVRQMHGVRRRVTPGGQVAPQGLRDEWCEGCEQLGEADEAGVQREEGRSDVLPSFAGGVPEPPAGAPHVPVRQVVHEGGYPPAGAGRVVGLEAVAGGGLGPRELREHPSVQERPLRNRDVVALGRVEPARVRVRDKERVHVPQGEQELPDDVVEHLDADPARRPR
jgi:hypothetical protein